MEIIGGGFIARHLRSIADRHPDTVAFAAGVSSTRCTVESEYARELAMLRSTIADCLRTRRRLLYFSTSSAEMYGAPHCRGRETDRPALRSPYGQHKSTVERLLAETRGLDFLVLRVAHLVGANQPAHQLVPALARQIGEGEVRLHRGAYRDLIAVADAVRIIDILLSTADRRDVVNVATGVSVPIEQIVAHLEDRLETAARKCYVVVSGHYPVSVEKLTRLAPEIGGFGFGPDYYRHAIDSYLETAVVGRPVRRPA